MEPLAFERWVLQQFRKVGYEANPTPTSGDGGADAIIRDPKNKIHIIMQCKHRQSGKVDKKIIEDLLRAKLTYHLENSLLVGISNQNYTNLALEHAKKNKIILIDRNQLLDFSNIFAKT